MQLHFSPSPSSSFFLSFFLFPPKPISHLHLLLLLVSLSMSSLLNLQGMVLATAMAVSGSVILFALCRQRPFSAAQIAVKQNSTSSNPRRLRSCISSHDKMKREKSKKRVHFALDVVESVIDESSSEEEEHEEEEEEEEEEEVLTELKHVRTSPEVERQVGKMPANRLALYNGILQDRMQRMACSY